jgi:hypothetical protein
VNNPITGTSTIVTGNWYNIANRFDLAGGTFRAYNNGSREVSSTTTLIPSRGGTMKVGISVAPKTTGNTSGGGWNGSIDEVRISNIARSEDWIAASSQSVADTYNTYASEETQGAGALSSTNVEPATLVASAVGTTTISFTTVSAVPSTGKIVITFPTSLGAGYILSSGGTSFATSSSFDGALSTSVSGNVVTITRSGGTSSAAGAKTILLSFVKNPNTSGSTGVYSIKTTTSADATIDQDLAVTADTISSATLSSTNVQPASLVSGVSGNVTVSFTTTNTIPSTGKIVVTLPTSLGTGFITGNGGGTAISGSVTGIDGTFTISTTTNTVTLTRVGDGNGATAGAKSFVLTHIRNPNAAGSTGTYQITTKTSGDVAIDQDSAVTADSISGVLTSTDVQPASMVAGASGNVDVSFVMPDALPSTGKIVITLPTSLGGGFTLDSGGLTGITSASGIDGTFTVSTTSSSVTVTRSGDGTSSATGTKSFTLTHIKNPTLPGSTGTYQLATKTSADVVLDQDTAVTSDSISTGALSSTNVEPASLVASATGDVAVSFTTANPIPVDGSISIYMPLTLGSGFVLDSGGTTSISSVVGIDGTLSVSSSVNNFITITRNGDGTISSAGAKSFTLSHIKNPDITGSTDNYTIETRNASTIDIDQDLSVAADTITAPPDSTPPVISAIASSSPSGTTALITWTTDENASSTVNYGTTSSYGSASSSQAMATSHSITLSGLSVGTTYHFNVGGADVSGNISTSSDATFTTIDDVAPLISSIASTTTGTTATITWTTNENSTSTVDYGATSSYGSASTSASVVTSHSVVLTGLSSGSTYHFRVGSADASGNQSTSTDQTFTTATVADVTAPIISAQSVSVTSSTSAAVSWTTDENASSQVVFGANSSVGSSTVVTDTSPRVTSHTVSLSNLSACGEYYYKVISADSSGNISTSTSLTFNTSGCVGGASITAQTDSSVATSTGGTVSLSNNGNSLGLTVPSGFSTTTLDFQIKKVGTSATLAISGTPTGLSLANDLLFDLKAFSDSSTIVSSFTTPLTITVSYSDSDISGLNESTLVIKRYDGADWQTLSGCVVDTAANTITCSTSGFSVFGLFGEVSSSGSSGGGTVAYGSSYNPIVVTPTVTPTPYPSSPVSPSQQPPRITKALKLGMTDAEIVLLQRILNADASTQIALSGVGSPGHETTYFGPATKAAVIKFQLKYKLIKSSKEAVAGLVGPGTRSVLNTLDDNHAQVITPIPTPTKTIIKTSHAEKLTKPLKLGMTDIEVVLLQKLLNTAVSTRIATTGAGSPGHESTYFGAATKAAVIKFQLSHGLIKTAKDPLAGIVGPGTRAALNQ